MLVGSGLITLTHVLFAMPLLNHWLVAMGAMLVLGVGFSLVPSAMWPSVPKIIPERQLGTAYALIFFIQNLVAMMGIPYLVGFLLDRFCVTGREVTTEVVDGVARELTKVQYDYTWPMIVFVACGVLAVAVALLLKGEDRRKNYGLEIPCHQR